MLPNIFHISIKSLYVLTVAFLTFLSLMNLILVMLICFLNPDHDFINSWKVNSEFFLCLFAPFDGQPGCLLVCQCWWHEDRWIQPPIAVTGSLSSNSCLWAIDLPLVHRVIDINLNSVLKVYHTPSWNGDLAVSCVTSLVALVKKLYHIALEIVILPPLSNHCFIRVFSFIIKPWSTGVVKGIQNRLLRSTHHIQQLRMRNFQIGNVERHRAASNIILFSFLLAQSSLRWLYFS